MVSYTGLCSTDTAAAVNYLRLDSEQSAIYEHQELSHREYELAFWLCSGEGNSVFFGHTGVASNRNHGSHLVCVKTVA